MTDSNTNEPNDLRDTTPPEADLENEHEERLAAEQGETVNDPALVVKYDAPEPEEDEHVSDESAPGGEILGEPEDSLEDHLEVTETELPKPIAIVPEYVGGRVEPFKHEVVSPWAESLPQLRDLGVELLTQLRDLAEGQIEVPVLLSIAEHALRKAHQIAPSDVARFIEQLPKVI